MRVVLFLSGLCLVFTACGTDSPNTPDGVGAVPPPLPPDGSYSRPFSGRGIITEIRGEIIQIDHETIPGFMAAVTMDFPLEDPALAEGLEPGDEVTFSVQVLDAWSHRIIRIEEVESSTIP